MCNFEETVARLTAHKSLVIMPMPDHTWYAIWRDRLTSDGWDHWFTQKPTLDEVFQEIIRIEAVVGNV